LNYFYLILNIYLLTLTVINLNLFKGEIEDFNLGSSKINSNVL